MKGIIKYQQKFYKKVKPRLNIVNKGVLIKLECKRKSDYFKYNGIYTVVSHFREIEIKNYDENGRTLSLKLGYNIGYDDFSILKETEKKKSLSMPAKEEQEYKIN